LPHKFFWCLNDLRRLLNHDTTVKDPLSCDICQRVKRNTQARNAPLHPLPIQDVFARWHMDILAGLPKTKEGYQYILLGMIWAGMVSCNIKEFAKYGNNFWKKILSSVRHKASTSPVPSKNFTIKNVSYFLSFLCF
jgi:hypothetical protein